MDPLWKPNLDTSPNCPRCGNSNTKFCYYNNYSLTQPRYFCKGCRRYWTKGGSLRNVPVGGGCRKTRRGGKSFLRISRRHQPHTTFSDHSYGFVDSTTSTSPVMRDGSHIDLALVYANFLNQKTPVSKPIVTSYDDNLVKDRRPEFPLMNLDTSPQTSLDINGVGFPAPLYYSEFDVPIVKPRDDVCSYGLPPLPGDLEEDGFWLNCDEMVETTRKQSDTMVEVDEREVVQYDPNSILFGNWSPF